MNMILIEDERVVVGVLEWDETHKFVQSFGRQHFVVVVDSRLFDFDFAIRQHVASASRCLIEGYY